MDFDKYSLLKFFTQTQNTVQVNKLEIESRLAEFPDRTRTIIRKLTKYTVINNQDIEDVRIFLQEWAGLFIFQRGVQIIFPFVYIFLADMCTLFALIFVI